MFETYNVNGQKYEVSQDQLQRFLKDFPNAVKEGKAQDSTVDPTMSQDDMGSELDDGSSESQDDDVSWFDQTWFGRGIAAASTTGEATDLMAQDFSNIDMESIQEFMKAKEQESKSHVASERMNKFQKKYKEEGSTWSAFFRGVRDQPGLLPELFVQSLGTQVGTAIDSPGASLSAAAAGAALGASVGAVPGAVAGLFGGLATSMEAALTFGELIETELKKEGKEFTDENIKALLEGPKGNSIRNKSIGRGLTIGAIEGFSGGIAGKAAVATKGAVAATRGAKTATIAASTAGVVVEGVGGGLGEVGGRLAAGQEMDAAEIGFEAITGTVTAPINIATALSSAKQPTYNLNGADVTYKEMKDFVETADDVDVAKANIQIKDDFTGVGKLATEKQNKAITKSQVDDKITDEKDIEALVSLAFQRDNAKADLKKEGINQVPGAEKNLADIEAKINDIIGKYEGAADAATTQKAEGIRKARRDVSVAETIAFSETQGKRIGKETIVVDNDQAAQEAANKLGYKGNVKGSDGFIVGNSIIINKDVAGRSGAISVGSHEVLHGVLAKHMQGLSLEGRAKLGKSFMSVLTKEQDAAVRKRLKDNYQLEGDNIFSSEEIFTAFSDAIEKNEITFNEGIFSKLKNTIQEILRKFGIKKDFADGRQAYNFLKDYSKSIEKNKLSSRAMALAGEGAAVTEGRFSKSNPEALIKIIKRGGNPRQVKTAEDALVQQYQALAVEALGYKEAKGDIRRENVVSAVNEYYEAIVRNYDPKKGAFSTHVYNNIAPKNDTIFEKAKTLAKRDESVSIDAPEARQVAGDAGVTTNTEKTFVQKINILQDFAIANRVADKIKALVKVAKGDNFKSIISKYAGKVGELIFEVPANKIMEGGANLAAVTKYTEGMPAPAEAQNIQRFFNAPNNADKFIKTLPLYNVTDKTADINKVGENLDVSRDTYGYAIGLKGLPLDYFYENYTDPTGEITSPKGRSKGLTSQTQVKRLKPQFRKPTPETVEQFKKDLGITPKNEANVYSRDIGQLLKGVAKVHSINAAISGAQRFQEAKTKAAPVTEQKAIKQQTADITAAQSKIAFSKSVDEIINIRSLFELETKGVDMLLKTYGVNKTFNLKTEEGVNEFVTALKTQLLPLMPKDFWFGKPDSKGNFGTVFTGSSKVLGTTDAAKKLYKKYYEPAIKNLASDPSVKFGKSIDMVKDYSVSAYSTIFKDAKTIEANKKNGKIKEWNKKVSLIHEAMWSRFNDAIAKDKNNATIIGNYMKMVGSDTKHWHKRGAQFVGHSKKITGTRFEYEHAMPATAAYLYLMDAALSDSNFNASYRAVINNYKLIALDKAMDIKLTSVGLQRRMPEGWDLMQNNWWNRYFNDLVNNIEGGIDPTSIIGLEGKTFGKMFNIKKPITKENLSKTKTLNKAIEFSRSANNPTKGITVLDFDDTLATTKSGVRAKIPNMDGLPKPKRKVVFLAGGAGSGKGNVISKLGLKDQGFKVVNSDISLEWLKKNSGLPANMNDFTKEQRSKLGSLQYQARGIAKRKMTKYKGNADGVVVDGTGGSIKSMEKLVNEFKNKGYDVSMMFVETSLPVALERNAARKERSLLDKIVTKNHESVQGNKDGFKTMFGDRFMEVNTDNLSQQDAMPTKLTEEMNDFVSGYENRRLDAEEFASEGADILEQGGTFDFSEFNKVVEGQTAPLFEKAMKLQKKFGNKDMFVLTARPAESAQAIFEFLKANGLNIPIKNITGLANSTSEAKALWMADKVGEGFNDFYFADDALQNVQAVKNMLDQFDVKSKVQQARVKFSKSLNDQFNDILENITGIEADKKFSAIKGRKRGESKGKFRYFIPPSHEDFVGLLYNFLGKGKEGNKHRDFFEQALVRPLNRANREFDTARQSVANDYKALNKQFEDVKSKLTKKTPDGDFTFQDAIRIYLWDKHGHKIPGLSETDQTKLAELVMSDPQLQAYAETLNVISKQETYVNPTDGWNGGDIRMDLDDATGRIGRKEFFSEFIENADIIFSEENLNKIEAGYGKDLRESLEDILYRIQTGRNRPSGQNAQVNKLMNYLNGSVGTVMFFNMRSALLQQMSIVNYINFADNNVFAAAKAFANQKQYWSDWSFIFNSDMLKQRRGGIQTDVNGAELAASLRNSKDVSRKLISKLLELGFLPTQIGDNIAIATGGASYYRNRINTYLKQGLSQKEAEAKAFTDFQDITQSTQQSARPDMVSKQQASVIGKVILNFQNVTSQFNRLGKKAFQDIYNRRITKPNSTQMQSDISNASRITYYFAVQNLIFYTLQTALFAMMFDDEEEDNNNLFLKKKERLINGSIDSVLRGTGLIGGVVATLKNVAIAFARQRDVKYNPDESAVMLEALNLSPVLGIKGRKIVNAEKTLNYNKKVIDEMETFDIDNPQWSAVTNYTEALTNVPLNRLYNKTQNVRQALNNEHAAWERTLMFLGWSQYNLDLENKKMEEIKEKTKSKKKTNTRSKTRTRTRSRTRTR